MENVSFRSSSVQIIWYHTQSFSIFLLYLYLGKGKLHCLQFYSHCQLFLEKITEKMRIPQATSTWLPGGGFCAFPCPPLWFPAPSLLPFCLSLSLFQLMLLTTTSIDSSGAPRCTLELPENTLSPSLFHTVKIKHSRRTLLPGETDWLHLWQVFYLCWNERQQKIRCSPTGSLRIQWKEAPNLKQPRIPVFWTCPTIYKSLELAPLITAQTCWTSKR